MAMPPYPRSPIRRGRPTALGRRQAGARRRTRDRTAPATSSATSGDACDESRPPSRRPAGGCGGRAHIKLNFGNYSYLFRTTSLQGLAELDLHRLHLDPALPADRLSDGLWHRALAADLAQHPADAGDPAVLDLVPAARLCVDRHPQEQRPDQQLPDLARHHRRAAADDADRTSRSTSASSIPTCRS